ncbi:MAG: hypothetical protein GY745_19475 [Actinomycetia bacterium]|nr:hypothetical protein [Actinomycetes bacterium]
MPFVDLSHVITGLALERVADVPALCFDRRGERRIELSADELTGATGHAVLVHTGHSANWGTDRYVQDHPFLTGATAERLVEAGVACVGIDSLNIDSTEGGERPVHSILLGAEIPIVEHLTGLERLPAAGFRFNAVPPKIEGAGTFTVRAFAATD